MCIGKIYTLPGNILLNPGRAHTYIEVRNKGDRPIQVNSSLLLITLLDSYSTNN